MRQRFFGTSWPVLILLTGFGLRITRLGAQSLWYDETVSAVLAQKTVGALIAHTARDIHPPGYYLLLHGWTRLAGDSEFALAFFSVIFGMLLIAGVYGLARRLLNQSVALWAAALTAISAYNVWYSQEVRMYTLGAFLGLLTVWFGLAAFAPRLISHSPPKYRQTAPWLYASIAALGMYTLYYFAFLLIALNLVLAIFLWIKNRPGLKTWLAANFGAAIAYLPWLPIAFRQAVNPPVPPWRSAIPLTQIALESWSALSLGESVAAAQVWPLLLLTLGLFVIGLWAVPGAAKRVLLAALPFGSLLIIVLLPLLTGSPLYHPRYLFTYSPAFFVVLGAGLNRLWAVRRLVGGVGFALLLAGNAGSMYRLHTDPQYAADDLRGAVQFIEQHWRPGDVIITNAGYTYTAFRYYVSGPALRYRRLTNFAANPDAVPVDSPLVLQTGAVDGPETLGWGNPQSDFYAMSHAETEAALQTVSSRFARIWMLRAYDTVTDPQGVIRRWLAKNTTPFEDQPVSGPSNFRVQGFLSESRPPPNGVVFTFSDRLQLTGFVPPVPQVRAGTTIDTALWLTPLANLSGEAPYAVSLKLWDEAGQLAAQVDEWPVGSLYFSPAWRVGSVIRYPMRLTLPADIAVGRYWLDAIVYQTDTQLPLTVIETNQSGVTLGGIEVIE